MRADQVGGAEAPGTAGGLAAVRGFASVRGYRPTPVPVRLRIPAIGVDTGLQRLGRTPDGTVEVAEGRHPSLTPRLRLVTCGAASTRRPAATAPT